MTGPAPFTYSDIESYCRLKGIDSLKERERMTRLIDALDRAYMAAFYEKQAAKSPAKNGATPPPTHSPPRNGRSPRRPRKTF